MIQKICSYLALVIAPLTPLVENAIFTLTVHYHGQPTPLLFDGYNTGWLKFTDSIGVGNEPNGAATWYLLFTSWPINGSGTASV